MSVLNADKVICCLSGVLQVSLRAEGSDTSSSQATNSDPAFAGPDKKLKLSVNYPASVGRNMDEIVRVVDALQLSAKHSVVSLRHQCSIGNGQVTHCISAARSKHLPCKPQGLRQAVQGIHRHLQHGGLLRLPCCCAGHPSELAQQPRVHWEERLGLPIAHGDS
jgi:hypothetical protein